GLSPDRRPPEALVSSDVVLPYSKGLMAKTLMATGLRPERAYELARLIEERLVRGGEEAAASAERLHDVAAEVVGEHQGDDAVRRLRRLQALRELDLPLVLMVGGATGTGKSSVATEVAHRLGVTRVTSTDVVRQTMRAFFSRKFMPSIHHSSFNAGATVGVPDEGSDPALLGFLEQTRNVLVGVRAVIGRALEEGYSVAVEGVHLVPGSLPRSYEGAVVCQCLLAIEDEEEHARHFWVRDAASSGLRPMHKYLKSLPEIRRIQDHLLERARKHGVPVVENTRMEDAVDTVVHLVLDEVEKAQDRVQASR
ncbi:MAG: 2-phosphoglycerate kinase, partial [Gaiellaceae bacterium]